MYYHYIIRVFIHYTLFIVSNLLMVMRIATRGAVTTGICDMIDHTNHYGSIVVSYDGAKDGSYDYKGPPMGP